MMNAKDAIKNSIQMADMVCGTYMGDLSNEEAMKRPHPGCNHINWQVGHLIAADHGMFTGIVPGGLPELPEGFREKYEKGTAGNDDAAAFVPFNELLALAKSNRAAILSAIDGFPEEKLDAEAPEAMRAFAPTVGAVFNMLGSHWLMHAGQWVIVRRELGREVAI